MSEAKEEEIKQLKDLNNTLSNALAAEMTSNFKQAHIRQNLEEKIEKIEEECNKEPRAYISASFIKKILNDES